MFEGDEGAKDTQQDGISYFPSSFKHFYLPKKIILNCCNRCYVKPNY